MFALEKQSYTGLSGPNAENSYNNSDKIKAAAAINTDTPSYEVQPLVIRCNVGDCIEINLTNKDLPKASVMIKRAEYDVQDAEGNLVGNITTPGSLDKGQSLRTVQKIVLSQLMDIVGQRRMILKDQEV